jgi:hypothetical protein
LGRPVDNLELDLLLSEVCGGAKYDIQIYHPQGVSWFPQYDPVERGLRRWEIAERMLIFRSVSADMLQMYL